MHPNDTPEETEDESECLNNGEVLSGANSPAEDDSERGTESDDDDDGEEEEGDDESEDRSDADDGTGDDNNDSEDSEEEDDEGDESESSSEENGLITDDEQPIKRAKRTFPEDEADSNSSDGQSEKCPICLSRFVGQEIGSPESCDHTFCLECISEWSKNMNTCPVDRKVFEMIYVRQTLIGKIVRQVPVEGRRPNAEDEEDDATYCEVCGRCDREDRLLLCDGCDLGFHLECLTPPLTTVPVEEWFCPDCETENQQNLADETDVEDGEALALLDDADHPNTLRLRGATRLLPRTRQSERVRLTIEQSRARRRGVQRTRTHPRTNGTQQPSTSNGSRSRRTIGRRRPGVATKKRKTVRKRKTTKKRKRATKQKRGTSNKATSSTGAKRKRRRRKKKKQSRRHLLRKPRLVPINTPKSRLAEQLGLKKILPNHFLPIMQAPGGNRVPQARQPDLAVPSLRLFGRRNELDPFNEGYEDDGGIAVAQVVSVYRNRGRMGKVLSASAVLSHRPVTRPGSLARIALQVPSEASMPPEPQTFDLLGTILDGQSILTQKSKHVTIKRDGSLLLNQLPANGVSQRPVDPVHGSRSGGSSHKSGTSSSQPSGGGSSGGHRWSRSHRGSSGTSEMHSSGRSFFEYHRSGGSGDGHGSFDGGSRSGFPQSGKKLDKRAEKEFKKQAEDDDIDIYSDIEPGFDNEGDEGTMDQIGSIENLAMVDGNSPVSIDMANSQHRHLGDDSIENEMANCSDDACSEDGLVIDESVKHDDGSEAEHSDQNFDQSDESDDNDLVIDEVAGKEEESEDENVVTNRPGGISPKVNLDIEDISTCEEEEEDSCKGETANNEVECRETVPVHLCDSRDEEEENVTRQGEDIESCSDSERGETSMEPEPNAEVCRQRDEPNGDDDGEENQAASADEGQENTEERREELDEEQDGADEDVEQSENELVEEENELENTPEELEEEEQEEEEEEADVEAAEPTGNVDDDGELSDPEDEEDQDEEENQNPTVEALNVSQESDREDAMPQENPEMDTTNAGSEHDSENEDVAQSEASQNNLAEPLSNEDEEHLENMAASLREMIESPERMENPVEEGEIEDGEQFRRRKLRIVSVSGGAQALGLFHRHQSPQQPQRLRRRRGSRDYEEGEIVDDSPPPRKPKGSRKSRTARVESPDEYDAMARVNIAELPRIPKIKRDSRPAVEHSEAEVVGAISGGNPTGSGSFDVKRTGVLARLDAGSTSEISWKKLSQNTRTRNYRAGKPKIEQKHVRQREAKKVVEERGGAANAEEIKKWMPEVAKEKRKEKEREVEHYAKHTEPKEWPRAKHEKRSSSKHDKEPKHKEKHRDKHKGEKHKEWKEKHKHGSGKGRDAPVEKLRDRSYDKYEKMVLVDKKEKKEQKREKLRKELERIHREEKHREERQQHREHKKREKEKQQQAAAAAAMVITNVVSLEQSREASPIESKEVYASGDSIIVNVNFSRPVGKENVLKEGKGKDEKQGKSKDKEHSRKLELESGGRERSKKADAYPKEKFREKSSVSKKRELDELKKESKRIKYDESRMTHREVIVRSNQARWNPFGDDPDDPSPPLDLDQKSVGSDSPIIVQDDGTDLRDVVSDSDDDIIEIIPCNVASGGNAVSVAESAYGDEQSQSPVLVSEEADEFANYDSASNEQVPCSPPSPAEDNSVYDPFEPTKSPTPISSPEPPSPPPSDNEKMESLQPPPPLPELPPLPPEPEPDDPAPPSPETELEASPVSSLNITIQTSQTSVPAPSLTPRRSPQAPPPVQSTSNLTSLPSPNLPPQCMPPPISLPNIRVPPPNYIPRNMQPSPGAASVPMPPLRPIGWPVGTPNLMFPPSQQLLRAAGNFLGPPPPLQGSTAPTSHSVTLTQIGTLLHNQAAQLAILTGVRPPPAGMPPPIGLTTLLHPHGSGVPFLPSSNVIGTAQNGDMRRPQQDTTEVIDMDVDSPYSPGDTLDSADPLPPVDMRKEPHSHGANENARSRDRFDSLLGSAQSRKENVPAKMVDKTGHGVKGRGHGPSSSASKAPVTRGDSRHREENRRRAEAQRKHIVRFEVPERQAKAATTTRGGIGKDKKPEDGKKEVTVKMDETQLKILDELPSSAVEMQVKEKFLKKLNRQERVIEEVKLAIKPYYNKREINKEEYKEILRKSVPKICHNKSGEINPVKIKALVEGYVKKFRYHRKKEGKVSTSKKS